MKIEIYCISCDCGYQVVDGDPAPCGHGAVWRVGARARDEDGKLLSPEYRPVKGE